MDFSIKSLKDSIPAHCFQKNSIVSLYYLFRDIGVLALIFSLRHLFFTIPYVGALLYWNLAGFYMWCLFVIGHDCGHGSFSDSFILNFICGTIAHTPLCVPYFGWAVSHKKHHQNHNHIERDHSWKPLTKTEYKNFNCWPLRFSPLLLWLYPVYLIHESNFGGFSGNHFNPWSPLFKKNERFYASISSICVICFVGLIHYSFNFWSIVKFYWIPYLIFIAWLDLVTFLQHTDTKVKYYRGEAWNYLSGALSTIDRSYGFLIDPFNLGYGYLLDNAQHNIGNCHMIHHIFYTTIPHYKLSEATNAVLPILKENRVFDSTPIPLAFYKSLTECLFVDDEKEICEYSY